MRSVLDQVVPADLRRLLRTAARPSDLAGGALLMFLSAWGVVAAPWLIGKAVNDLRHGSTGNLALVSLGVAGAGVFTALTSGAATWFLGRSAIATGMRIREMLHERLLAVPFDVYRRYPTGQLVARATADVEPIKLLIASGVSVATQLAGSVGFALTIMFLIDPTLAVIALAPFPLGVFVQLRYSKRTQAATALAEQRRGELAALASDNVRGARLIMSLGRESGQQLRFDRTVRSLFDGWLAVGRLDSIYGPLLSIVPYIGLGLVLVFGGRAVVDGRISLGEFVTFYGFLGILTAAAGQVTYLTYLTASAGGSASRIVELLDSPAESVGAHDGHPSVRHGPDVRLRDVRLAYVAEAPLRGMSLELRSGETVALVGVTGSGMATALEVVNGLLAPEQGTVELNGQPLRREDLSRLRRLAAPSGIGYLFAMSIAENIAYGRPEASRADIEAAAGLAGADEFIVRLTGGYEAPAGEGGAQLSGGERQRIALARALLAGRPMLLLDDVTSALDPTSANHVIDGLADAEVSSTRLLTTHGAAALRLADRIVVMNAGQVIGAGTHRELLDGCSAYRKMVELWELA